MIAAMAAVLVTLSREAVEITMPAREMMATTMVIVCMNGSVLILKINSIVKM